MEFHVLGSVRVVGDDGTTLRIPGSRERTVLALLVLSANEVVSSSRLMDELSMGDPSPGAAHALQVYVSRLRKIFREAGHATLIETRATGYLLQAEPESVDAARFEMLVAEARKVAAAGDPTRTAELHREGLGLWRGAALADVDAPSARSEATRLEEGRLASLEECLEADLACGRHAMLVAELEALTRAHPLRERLWELRMLALYRAGRQAEALRACQELRHVLAETVGLAPRHAITELENAIFRHDRGLDWLPTIVDDGQGDRHDLGSGKIPASSADRTVAASPETRYAKNGDVHIAYQSWGHGPIDLIVIPPMASNVEVAWEEPSFARYFRRFEGFCRYIHFDKRGTGMSERAVAVPTLEERMDDLRAVMDAVGSPRAAVMGCSEGGPMAALFAATYPERTSALILFGSMAKWAASGGHHGAQPAALDDFEAAWAEHWGTRSTLTVDLMCPSRKGDEDFLRWLNHFERQAATPAGLKAIMKWNRDIDVRSILPVIRVPTLVLHRTGDRAVNIENGRYLAAHIPDAELVELAGDDHKVNCGDSDAIVDEIEKFLINVTSGPEPDRMLATVLFYEIVEADGRAPETSDAPWRDLLDAHHHVVQEELGRFRGRRVRTTTDGFLAIFDGPARAIRCALAIRDAAKVLGIGVRVGLHAGEVEVNDDDINGPAVRICARIAALARAGDVLVSSTVKDLVIGSGIQFEARADHELDGIPGLWRLFVAKT